MEGDETDAEKQINGTKCWQLCHIFSNEAFHSGRLFQHLQRHLFQGKVLKCSTEQSTLIHQTQQVISYLVPFVEKKNSKCRHASIQRRNQYSTHT
jgi:hypothetical protein